MNPDKYRDSGQLTRACGVLRVLFGHTFRGLLPGEIAKATGSSPANVTRMLALLSKEAFVERIGDSNRWRLGPKLVQGALAHVQDLDRTEHELGEVKQRYSRRN